MKHSLKSKTLCSVLASLVIAACGAFYSSTAYIPANLTSEPITSALDGFAVAEQVAHNWDKTAYLVQIASVYSLAGEELSLKHSYYNFVSGNKERYIGITIDSSGRLEVDPPANVEGAFISTSPHTVEKNTTSEPQAMQLAWSQLGIKLKVECGPVEGVSIEGVTLFDASQIWTITYSGSEAILGSVDIDSTTGETLREDVNDNMCDLQ